MSPEPDQDLAAPRPRDPPAAPPGDPPAPPAKERFVETLRRAPVSALLVAVNIVVFLLAERAGDTTKSETLVRFGAVNRHLVWDGQYWRLATAMFLHIGLVHVAWNCWMGFRISVAAERAIGPARFLALYLISGIVASATSVIGHDAISAGASGALFGLIGWRLVALRVQLGSFKAFTDAPGMRQELIWIAIWFAMGAVSGFDNYAHAGGLGFGALFAWTLYAPAGRRKLRLAVTVVAALAWVLLSLRPLPFVSRATVLSQKSAAGIHVTFVRPWQDAQRGWRWSRASWSPGARARRRWAASASATRA